MGCDVCVCVCADVCVLVCWCIGVRSKVCLSVWRLEIELGMCGASVAHPPHAPPHVPLMVLSSLSSPDMPPWSALRAILDEIWFIEIGREEVVERLVRRHIASGDDLEAAQTRALGSDAANGRLIESSKPYADLAIEQALF